MRTLWRICGIGEGYLASDGHIQAHLYVCQQCGCPTFLPTGGAQVPGSPCGDQVADINDKGVSDLYDEARRCTANNAFTAAVLACRKLLMHIAVAKGAKEGGTLSATLHTFRIKG